MKNTNLIHILTVNENLAFKKLHEEYFQTILKYILKNNGSKEDAEDIFQDTLVIFHQKLNQEDFEVTASIKTYLVAISKNLWLKKLRHDKTRLKIDSLTMSHFSYSIEQEKTVWDRLNYLITKMSETCRRLINDVFFKAKSDEQIKDEYGYKNIHTVQNMKHKCVKKLKKIKSIEKN